MVIKEARELHSNIGHPGDKAQCKELENGNLVPARVTCQDVKNAKIILGPCISMHLSQNESSYRETK